MGCLAIGLPEPEAAGPPHLDLSGSLLFHRLLLSGLLGCRGLLSSDFLQHTKKRRDPSSDGRIGRRSLEPLVVGVWGTAGCRGRMRTALGVQYFHEAAIHREKP